MFIIPCDLYVSILLFLGQTSTKISKNKKFSKENILHSQNQVNSLFKKLGS